MCPVLGGFDCALKGTRVHIAPEYSISELTYSLQSLSHTSGSSRADLEGGAVASRAPGSEVRAAVSTRSV